MRERSLSCPSINKIKSTSINKSILLNENIFNLINEDNYFIKCKQNKNQNKKEDENSICYLLKNKLKISLSQSDCIKIGIFIENFIKDIILSYNHNITSIKEKNKKGEKEKDHLFLDIKNKIIYYAEIKTNLNLDTEKSKETIKKILKIKDDLQKSYKNYTIKYYLVSGRYLNNTEINKKILNKYTEIKDNVKGLNDYLKELNVSFKFDYELYCECLKHFIDVLQVD